jgi:hypothetical protein
LSAPTVDDTEKLSRLLNASGFAFQLAVEAAVKASPGEPNWKVAAREHPWKTANGQGYIDLVLSAGDLHLAIECKRSHDATWLFLMPDRKQLSRSHARIAWTDTFPHRPDLAGWGDIQVYPASPESEFCVIRGQGEKDKPLLERLASLLCESIDGLATDLIELNKQSESTKVIIPVIVTNAELQLGEFNPKDVDLESGELASAKFSAVQSVRFRKSLAAASLPDDYEPQQLEDLSSDSERTVFVVQAKHLAAWLNEFQTSAPDNTSAWNNARTRSNALGGYR